MTDQTYITRKELAYILCVSIDSLKRNERRTGLIAAKVCWNRRLVRYKRFEALAIIGSLTGG
jgi:hypothetical protein